jgi:ATP-dependent Clp protease ATP-binding subunit ClpC
MSERYTEKARRVIFFACYEPSQYGSPYIETELLGALSGVSRRNPAISRGIALVANSLCPVQERRTMRESDVQIGNSGLYV